MAEQQDPFITLVEFIGAHMPGEDEQEYNLETDIATMLLNNWTEIEALVKKVQDDDCGDDPLVGRTAETD